MPHDNLDREGPNEASRVEGSKNADNAATRPLDLEHVVEKSAARQVAQLLLNRNLVNGSAPATPSVGGTSSTTPSAVGPGDEPPAKIHRQLDDDAPIPGINELTRSAVVRSLPSLGEVLRSGWRLIVPVAGLLFALALVAGYLLPVTYTAEARVIAGQGSAATGELEASGAAGQSMGATYSRVFAGDRVQASIVEILKGHRPLALGASPVPESSVIVIDATDVSSDKAVAAANAGSQALVNVVASTIDTNQSGAIWLKRYKDAARRQATAQANLEAALDWAGKAETDNDKKTANLAVISARTDVAAAQVEVQTYAGQYGKVIGSGTENTGVQILETAKVASNTRSRNLELLGAVGLMAGVSAGFVLAYFTMMMSRRPRRAALVHHPRTAHDQASGPAPEVDDPVE